MILREAAKKAKGVEVVEATVSLKLQNSGIGQQVETTDQQPFHWYDATLPMPNHGTVALINGSGSVVLYQISPKETRMLIDLKAR